jgi:hypothetical protein
LRSSKVENRWLPLVLRHSKRLALVMRGVAPSRLEALLFRKRQDNYRTLRRNETLVTKNIELATVKVAAQ